MIERQLTDETYILIDEPIQIGSTILMLLNKQNVPDGEYTILPLEKESQKMNILVRNGRIKMLYKTKRTS